MSSPYRLMAVEVGITRHLPHSDRRTQVQRLFTDMARTRPNRHATGTLNTRNVVIVLHACHRKN